MEYQNYGIKLAPSLYVPKSEIKIYEEFKGTSAQKRYQAAKADNKLIDACHGKKILSMITLKDGTIITTNASVLTINNRFSKESGGEQ